MKAIYTDILDRISQAVTTIKWVDYDRGQLDNQNQRPALAFPCALIGIKFPDCRDVTDRMQSCKATITVRLAFDTMNTNTNASVTYQKRDVALEPLDVIAYVYKNLQAYETGNFNSLSRKSQGDEKRSDGLFVYQIVFSCEIIDQTAE